MSGPANLHPSESDANPHPRTSITPAFQPQATPFDAIVRLPLARSVGRRIVLNAATMNWPTKRLPYILPPLECVQRSRNNRSVITEYKILEVNHEIADQGCRTRCNHHRSRRIFRPIGWWSDPCTGSRGAGSAGEG